MNPASADKVVGGLVIFFEDYQYVDLMPANASVMVVAILLSALWCEFHIYVASDSIRRTAFDLRESDVFLHAINNLMAKVSIWRLLMSRLALSLNFGGVGPGLSGSGASLSACHCRSDVGKAFANRSDLIRQFSSYSHTQSATD